MSDRLDSPGEMPISAPDSFAPQPDKTPYSFLLEGSDPQGAREDLAEAVSLLVERPALEAALADNSGDLAKVREGVELTLRQLTGALEKGRVVAVNPVGEKFDPHRHQAISMVPAEQEANTVVSVLQKGYVIADRVLRPALVTVAAPK